MKSNQTYNIELNNQEMKAINFLDISNTLEAQIQEATKDYFYCNNSIKNIDNLMEDCSYLKSFDNHKSFKGLFHHVVMVCDYDKKKMIKSLNVLGKQANQKILALSTLINNFQRLDNEFTNKEVI